jgi:aryl-alcohol dehydrogenase-like predicted oxidoreductase
LRTDSIDLYQLHMPDPLTPIEETLSALDELVAQGLVRYVGSSNLAAWQLVEAEWTARATGTQRFVRAQNRYNLLERGAEREILPACERYGVGLLPFLPLANGVLSGKYRKGAPLPAGSRLANDPERAQWATSGDALDRVEALRACAASQGVTLLALAIGGLAAQPAVASVIAGAMNPAQCSTTWPPETGSPPSSSSTRYGAYEFCLAASIQLDRPRSVARPSTHVSINAPANASRAWRSRSRYPFMTHP